MALVRTSVPRQVVAAVLLIVLTLSGLGRSLALADEVSQPSLRIGRVAVEICHTGKPVKQLPDDRSGHDCCEACALCAPVTVCDAAPFVAPARVEHFAQHADGLIWAPAVARVPTPRLSQGPPAA